MNLPPLSANNLKKSQSLINRLIQSVQKSGSIGFDEFLNLALYDSENGYYCHKHAIFGADGDFITAPTRSSLFSMIIAKQCLQILEQTSDGCIVELGPGDGQLTKDIVLYLHKFSALPESYFLIETSPALKEKQKELFEECIPEYLPKIQWINQEQIPQLSGVIIANELLDALPFKRLQVINNQFYEMSVSYEKEEFIWKIIEINSSIEQYIEKHIPNELLEHEQYQTEIHLMYEPLLKQIMQKLKKGVFLIMDYGSAKHDYYSHDKQKGTMRCFYQHRVHDDPYINIGFQDITSDVEFSAFTKIAYQNGYDILGYTTQANFLLGNDIQSIYNEIINNTDLDTIKLNSELKSLVMPDEMGERFKVLALGKDYHQSLDGFSFKDLTYSL